MSGDIGFSTQATSGLSAGAEATGVKPAQQDRSKAAFAALVLAGERLLESKSLSELRIEDVVRAADVSVGAFYSRFENKEAFFSAIQLKVVSEVFDTAKNEILRIAATKDDAVLADELAELLVRVYRQHQSVYIASARYVAVNGEAWHPFRELGHRVAAFLVKHLGSRLAAGSDEAPEVLVPMTLQVVNGTLLNAVLNNPGPVSIDDPRMKKNIARVMRCFFSLNCGQRNQG